MKTNSETFFLRFFNGCSMIYANVDGFKDSLKHDLALQVCENQSKDFSILTETYINHDQIRHIRNNWLGTIFFSLGDSQIKGLLVLFHPGLKGVSEVDTDPKRRFVSFKITPFIDRILCVYAISGHNTREQLARGEFL